MRVCLALFLLAICHGEVLAQPDSTTTYLAVNKVSVLDFGLYRLENLFLEESDFLRPIVDFPTDDMNLIMTDVAYDYDQDTIFLVYNGFFTGAYDNVEEAESKIDEVIAAISEWVGPWDIYGKYLERHSKIHTCFYTFSHKKAYDPRLYLEIERKIEIQAIVGYWKDGERVFRRGALGLFDERIEYSQVSDLNKMDDY